MARLYEALATLPPAERAAAVVAIGLDEGAVGVAMELGIDPEDADAVTRNALQLLRGALADIDLDEPLRRSSVAAARAVERRRRRHTKAPDWIVRGRAPTRQVCLSAQVRSRRQRLGPGAMDRAGERLATSCG